LDDVGLKRRAGVVSGVGVEAALAVGHDDDQRQAHDVVLDARPPRPGRVVVGQAVQQVQHGERAGLVVRHDGRERGHFPQGVVLVQVELADRHR